MVRIEEIREIRPKLAGEFDFAGFVPRTAMIAEAYRWGQELHAGQNRMSGEPYFETHCAWVANLVDKLVENEAYTIAALLHDSVEDRGGSLDQIRAHFPGELGEHVAYIVDGVTKLSAPREGRSRELETLRKIAMFRDPGVYLVKLADKSHNTMTLEHMPEARRRQKAGEAIRAYGRLAGILNCYKWRRWLEDIAFPHADPDAFNYVKPRIDSDPRLQVDFINQTMQQLGRIMERRGLDGRIEIIVDGYWQAWNKLRRMGRLRRTSLDSFTDVNDIISFRMILQTEDDSGCYLLLRDINRFFGPYIDQNQFDDYIATPQNGYRALQVTVYLPGRGAVEIAINTDEMEGENVWGVVYCMRHNKDISAYRPVEVFTPTGGARFVPEGSTVLDAIAAIQQEFLLNKISAVEVNGSLARLSDSVQPGDVIQVITGATRLQPSQEWLNYTNGYTARLLRVVLAIEGLRHSADQGRRLVRPVLAERGILALEDVEALERDLFDTLLGRLACASLEDLYSAVGGGAIRVDDLRGALDELGISKEKLNWTTIDITGSPQANRPGVLARLATQISREGGNIIRSINNTRPDGSYHLRLVVRNLEPARHELLKQTFLADGGEYTTIELV